MNCPKCNTPNPDGQKFCGNCGAELPQTNTNHSYSDNNLKPDEKNNKKGDKLPLYKRTWFLVVMCIFLPPVGLILTWVAKRPKNIVARIILTIILAIYTFSGFGNLTNSDDTSTKKNEVSQDTTTENKAKKEDKAKEKEVKTDTVKEEQKEPTLSPDEYKAQCQDVNCNDIMRNPDQYKGQKFKITVKIMSASHKITTGTYYKAYTDDGSGYYMDKMVWIFDKRDEKEEGYTKILEDDIVTFYGEFDGLQETKNALNGEKGEDFSLNAYYVDMVQEAQ